MFNSRARKIRCDGARPSCHNCSSRNSINDQCTYDAIPKRRGPDKTPRGRQHAAREGVLVVDEPVTQRRRRRSTNPQADYSRQAALDSNVLVSEREQSEECSPASANHEKKKPLPLDTAYERSFVVQPVATMGIQCTCHGSLACPDLIDPRLPIKSNVRCLFYPQFQLIDNDVSSPLSSTTQGVNNSIVKHT